MAKTQYLEYTIHLTDKAVASAKQTEFPDGVRKAPAQAAVDYAAPIQIVSAPFVAPCTRSPFFTFPVLLPSTLTNYPRHLATFTRKSGGWFGLSFLFGTTTTFIWVGKFAYAPSDVGEIDGAPVEVVAIAKRKWLAGWESLNHSAGMADSTSVGGPSSGGMVEASRHTDGMGWYAGEGIGNRALPSETGAAASNKTWERFYFKMLTAPQAASERMWLGSGGALSAGSLNMTIDRRIAVHNIDGAGTEVVIATSSQQFELGRWYRIDLLTEFKNPGGNIRVYINRKLEITAVAPAGIGMGSAMNHTTSGIGGGAIHAAADQFQCYYDDWMGAEWPTEDSLGRFVGLDWLNGSRIVALPFTGFGTGNNWLGDYRYANHYRVPATIPGSTGLTSSVSGDALRLVADERVIKNTAGALGAVQFMVAVYGAQSVAGQGTLGWKYDGVIDLASQVTSVGGSAEGGGGNAWFRRWFQPSGLTEPIANLAPFELHKVKALNANAATYLAAVVMMELIGVFGDEDVPEDAAESDRPTAIPPRRGIHNAPYPNTPWARSTIPPISPVIIHSGTYVGNGTVTELVFRCPVGWIWVRPVGPALAAIGSNWWSSMVQGHILGGNGASGAFPNGVMIDPSFVPVDAEDEQEQRTVFRISGADLSTNQNAVTYQYVAFMDPGSRYHLNGAYSNRNNAFPAPGKLMNLIHPTFLAEWGFFQHEATGSGGATFTRIGKGPGHAADTAQNMQVAEDPIGATFGAGTLRSRALVQGVSNEVSWPYSLWRDDDQSSDPNKHNVVKVGTYVGDGSATRSVAFATSGKRPLFAIVMRANGISYYRDPGHLTTTSHNMSGNTPVTDAITGGGIDTIIVSTALNANGVTYNYFILIGSATAGNGGWSIDGEFSVVEPDSPEDGDYDDPEESDPDDPDDPVDPDPDPGPDDDDDCDAGEVCVAATTRIVNEALLELGSTKILTNYCTQDTIEAQTARILYEPSVRAVLHAFPWPFATKYAALALTATQPTNEDFDFAYRQPVDCVFERRISIARGPGVDPKGPPFELSSDSSGGVIFTNEPNPVLEYTMRPPCVAFTGDALFREALKWHLAAAMAPPVTRMADKAKFCREQFEICIDRANAIIRPDDPGLRVTPAWQATDAACMTANISVVNLALLRIGANTIANLTTDQSREAVSANLIFEHELRATLRDFPWKFAKRYNDALVLVGGTDTVPVNPDWQYAYRLPADYVMVRRLPTTGTGRSFEAEPKTFEVGTDATGALLFTGEVDPNLEYTARIACVVTRADDLFRDALAWRLAASLAPSLAQIDPEHPEQRGRGPEHRPDPEQRISHKPNKAAMRERAARNAFVMYLRAIEKARVQDANEADPEPDGDAEWIRGRA